MVEKTLITATFFVLIVALVIGFVSSYTVTPEEVTVIVQHFQ